MVNQERAFPWVRGTHGMSTARHGSRAQGPNG